MKLNQNRLSKKRKWRMLRSWWRSKWLKPKFFKQKLINWKLNKLKELPKHKLPWMRKIKLKLNSRKLKLKSKNLSQLMNLKTQWVVEMLYKERKKDKTSTKLRLIKLPRKKNLNKKVKSINFLRNAKTTKTKQPLKLSLDNMVKPLRFTLKELIHSKVLSKIFHCGNKNSPSTRHHFSTTFPFATTKN